MKLPYIAAGFGLGLVLYPWFGDSGGTLSLVEEMGRQILLFGVTIFVAANIESVPRIGRIPVWIPALIATVACLILRRTVLSGLPFVPGDEDEYLFQAAIFAKGGITAPVPPSAHLFWAPGILIHGAQWFGHHQPGHSLFLALGKLLFGSPSVVPALFTGIVVLLLGLSARHIAGHEAGVLASLLAMTSPMLLLTGSTLVSETSSLLLVSLVFWLLIAAPLGKERAIYLAGAAIGILLNVRLVAGIGVILAAIALAGFGSIRRLLPGAVVGIVLALIHNQLTTGSAFTFPFQIYEPSAMGFKDGFGPGKAFAHLIRNVFLLNFWLLGWPISLILLKSGFREAPLALRRAAVLFVGFVALAYFFYWHPGQLATGALRFQEMIFPLLLLSAIGWSAAARSGSIMAKYVPLAIVFAHLGFLPVREAVLHDFVQEALEERRCLNDLNLDDRTVLLSDEGNLFHYPVNDPWLRGPVFMWAREPEIADSLFPEREQVLVEAGCVQDSCWWRVRSFRQ